MTVLTAVRGLPDHRQTIARTAGGRRAKTTARHVTHAHNRVSHLPRPRDCRPIRLLPRRACRPRHAPLAVPQPCVVTAHEEEGSDVLVQVREGVSLVACAGGR